VRLPGFLSWTATLEAAFSSDLDLMPAQAGGADDDGGKRGSLGPSRVAATFVPVFQSISTQATSKKLIFFPCFCFLLSMVIT
jgi:hypothetical protein